MPLRSSLRSWPGDGSPMDFDDLIAAMAQSHREQEGEAATAAGVSDPNRMEADAIARLAGHGGLICEREWDAAFMRDVSRSLTWAIERRGLADAANQFPTLLAVFIVTVANRVYEDRNIWSAFPWTASPASQRIAGQAFERAIKLRALEPFRGLRAEGAMRFVAPILAHGGIPRKLLSGFFRGLLLPALARGEGSSAEELIGRWRTTEPPGIPRPVLRFLRYGGAPAVDFVERCIELTELDRASLVREPSIAGLPLAVVEAFLAVPEAEVVPPSRAARPAITIDPWDAVGPELHLPAVGRERAVDLRWEIDDGAGRRVVAGSAHTERVVVLAPTASDWVVVSREPGRVRRFGYGATGTNAIVCFDANTLAYVRDERGIRADHLWILAEPRVELGSIETGDTFRPLRPAEEGAALSGGWSDHRLARFDLAGVDLLGVRRADAIIAAIPVSRSGDGAELVGAPVRDVVSVDGLPVYSAMPGLSLPAWGAWQVSLSGGGRVLSFAERVTAARRTIDLSERWGDTGLGSFELAARGPLGRDLRTAFAVVRGLRADTPDAVLRPDAGAIRVGMAIDSSLDLPGTGHPPAVTIESAEVAAETWAWERRDAKLGLLVRIPRLRWGLRREDTTELDLRTDVLALEPDQLGTAVRSLVVATGRRGASVRAVLEGERGPIQETRPRPAGPDGTAAVELVALRDAARAIAGDLRLVVEVGDIRAVVAEHRTARAASPTVDVPRLGSSVLARVVSVTRGALGVEGEGWSGLIHADRLPDEPRDHAVGEELEAWVIRNDDTSRIRLDARPFEPTHFPRGRVVEGAVLGVTPDGIWLEIDGVRAFAPIERLPRPPDTYRSGDQVSGRVVDASLQTRSLKLAVRPFEPTDWPAGVKVSGHVIRSTRDGLWVDLGGAVGHVHRGELAGSRGVDAYQRGEEVEGWVVGVDPTREQIELSLRLFDPGIQIGAIVEGRVERVNPNNVIVRLPSGAVGGIARTALPPHIADAPGRYLHEGTMIRVRVLWINPAERRIGLSARDGGDFTFGDDGDSESPFAVLRRPQEPE